MGKHKTHKELKETVLANAALEKPAEFVQAESERSAPEPEELPGVIQFKDLPAPPPPPDIVLDSAEDRLLTTVKANILDSLCGDPEPIVGWFRALCLAGADSDGWCDIVKVCHAHGMLQSRATALTQYIPTLKARGVLTSRNFNKQIKLR